MLDGLATWVIVGHSERRRDHGETDERIAKKLAGRWNAASGRSSASASRSRIRERGRAAAEALVDGQLRGAVGGHDAGRALAAGLVIAYEPVWAIGTGRNASGADAAAMAEAIRGGLRRSVGRTRRGRSADPVRRQRDRLEHRRVPAEPSIDGALVGGASLKPDEMAGIVARAAMTAHGPPGG